jgi:hypothetical protein
MSSKYTTTNLSRTLAKIVFMKHWSMAGALVRSKCMTRKSKEPYWIQKAVFHSSPGVIWMRLYTPQRSILVKTLELQRQSRRFRMSRWG